MLVVVFVLSACGASQPDVGTLETAVPTFAPPEGWNKFEGEGIDVWLPNSYQGGNLEKDLDVIVGRLETLGPEYEQIIQTIKANPSLFVLWAFDTYIGDTGFLTNMNITHEEVVSAVTWIYRCWQATTAICIYYHRPEGLYSWGQAVRLKSMSTKQGLTPKKQCSSSRMTIPYGWSPTQPELMNLQIASRYLNRVPIPSRLILRSDG
jgi:hypothetical protein